MLTDADWNELVDVIKSQVERAMADVVGGGAPRDGGLAMAPGQGAPKLVAGRVYTAGRWARLVAPGLDDDAFDYITQVQLPQPPALPDAEDWEGPLRFYVDVWDREITALEDPRLRDVGLRGADTCTRTQRVAQVKWCAADVDPEHDLPRRGDARLSVASPADDDEEFVPGSIGDFLFRLEVHRVVHEGDERVVTLKWSAENGAVVDRYVDFDAQWLDEKHVYEIFGEVEPLHLGAVVEGWPAEFPQRGSLHRHDAQLGWSPTLAVDPESSFVRRWDGCCTIRGLEGVWSLDEEQLASDEGVPLTTDSGLISFDASLHLELATFELALELGESTFVVGDHWLVAVRELDAIEVDELVQGLLPDGVEHTYFDLGLVDAEGTPAPQTDAERRRRAFPNLSDLRAEDVGYTAGETTERWEHDTGGSSPEHVHTALDMLANRKVSVSGGLVEGDLEIAGDLSVGGMSLFGSDVLIDGQLTVFGNIVAKDVEHVEGNVMLGDEDLDKVEVHGRIQSLNSSGMLEIEDTVHVHESLEVDGSATIGTQEDDELSIVGKIRFSDDTVMATAEALVPPGAVMAFAGESAPSGWLLCDGSAIVRDDYPGLFGAIGVSHGEGDGSTTFRIPDYRGRFLRGVDSGVGRDPDRESRVISSVGGHSGDAVGSVQEDQYALHAHGYVHMKGDNNVDGVDSVTTHSGEHHLADGFVTHGAGGSETRPKNANVNYIIKF